MDNDFNTLVLKVNYIGSNLVSVIEGTDSVDVVLLYFTNEIDSAEVPLSLTRGQAEQLHKDLEKILQPNNTI